MTKTTGQRIVEDLCAKYRWAQTMTNYPRVYVAQRIDQALETANAEVQRFRQALKGVTNDPNEQRGMV